LPARAGVQDHDGYTKLSEDAFLKYFANGVEHGKAEVLYAEQQPTAAARFGERTTIASWHSKPTFCAVSKNDQTMSPDLETLPGDTYESDNRGAGSGHLSLVWTPMLSRRRLSASASSWSGVKASGTPALAFIPMIKSPPLPFAKE